MGPFLKSAAIGAAIAVPLVVGYDLKQMRDDPQWGDLGAFASDIVVGGGATVTALAVAGISALVPAMRPAAMPALGIGAALAGATALGIGTVVWHGKHQQPPT